MNCFPENFFLIQKIIFTGKNLTIYACMLHLRNLKAMQ